MFARTKRLTLRPAWPEDAAALAAAIGHETVIRMLARVPLPYTPTDAEAFVTLPRTAEQPVFLIVAHDSAAPRLIGGIGIHAEGDRMLFGYWLTPDAWGRGYATEAGQAVIAMARHSLPISRLDAWHFADNPSSGRVLSKLGFQLTGNNSARTSMGRGHAAPAIGYALELAPVEAPMLIAA